MIQFGEQLSPKVQKCHSKNCPLQSATAGAPSHHCFFFFPPFLHPLLTLLGLMLTRKKILCQWTHPWDQACSLDRLPGGSRASRNDISPSIEIDLELTLSSSSLLLGPFGLTPEWLSSLNTDTLGHAENWSTFAWAEGKHHCFLYRVGEQTVNLSGSMAEKWRCAMIAQCQLGSEKGLPMAMTARFYLMTFGVAPSEQALTALVSPLTSSQGA